jgi:hypothetical protein
LVTEKELALELQKAVASAQSSGVGLELESAETTGLV